MKSVKLLQVCAIDLTVAKLLRPLVIASMNEGYQVDCACSQTGYFDELGQLGIRMEDVHIDRAIRPLGNLKSLYALYKLIKRNQYDIVHVHTPVASILGRLAAKLAGVKHIVYTTHGFYFHEDMPKLKYLFWLYLEKVFARMFTDWLLLQSKEDYDLCISQKFKKPNRIMHLSNGVDIHKKFRPDLISNAVRHKLRESLHIRENDIVLCFIGRFVREKGIFELVQAFEQVRPKHTSIKLLMVGSQLSTDRDPVLKLLEQRIASNPNIICTGLRQDIPELLAISDLFVLPSYREGLPRSIIEAMAMGLPIVASNIRGCREEVIDGENGFLVPSKNVELLADKLDKIVSDTESMKKMGWKSREIAEKCFDELKVIEKQIRLFNQLTGELQLNSDQIVNRLGG